MGGTLQVGRDALGALARAGEALGRGDATFRQVLDVLPAAVYVTDADGVITYYNAAAAALWGHRPQLGHSEWCGSWKLFWPDGRPLPHAQCAMALALKEKRPIHGMEAVAERPDGTRVHFMPFSTPLFDEEGNLTGAVNMLVDISDRTRSADSAERLASIVESSDDAIISKDMNGFITSWNSGAERLFGYTAAEAIGKPVSMLISEDRANEEPGILERIRHGEPVSHYETVRKCKDGSLVEISLTVSPLRDFAGNIIGASKIARDITEIKQAQERQNLLVSEMKHRIRNTLMTVQAIAMQTLRTASPEEKAAFMGRLHSLAGAHDLLTLERWERTSLRELIEHALRPFREQHRNRFSIDGPDDVWLDGDKSVMMIMVLHELATNAVKYGALSNREGRVNVFWERRPDGAANRIKLRWQERDGPLVRIPERKGFGSSMVERALGNLGQAHISFDANGVVFDLDMKA